MGPIGTSAHTYGPNARCFVPERWLGNPEAAAADGTTSDRDAEERPATAASAAAGGPPDPLTFSYGPRDCIGQALAKMELQVVVASLVAKFAFKPGAALQKAVSARCAEVGGQWDASQPSSKHVQDVGSVDQGTAAAVVRGIFDLAHYHITLQPLQGMLLAATPRA
jgi:hypothetical protein